ncbi:lysylphosphatidylglycerol synthase domain-containing protein [uncultured Lacinutrix sp.]|uniref:lysylphosphatidylglycerol synthase domain-containing protein n=1 Tax=uncultured Lacinutrix sp. TaxID=574032 RepID=UPI002622EA3F|nr:lysylphosphatidylglycerol synthase domain-containing protein [uncultured Lacinutrix sp.]
MTNALPYKTKQFFFALIKLSIVVGAFYFIYNKLTNNDKLDFSEFVGFLKEKAIFSTKNIIFLVFLTLFNWFFEIIKWRVLISFIKKVTFFEALQQSLGSLTASLFTPNRIGEYGAKAIYFARQYRKKVLLLNLISNVMQMSITVILGCIGFWFFASNYTIDIDYFRISRFAIIILVVLSLSVIGVKQNRYKVKGFKIDKLLRFVKDLPAKLIVLGLLYSLLRYFIFSFQFYFLLQLFGINIIYIDAMIVITSMYLLSSIIPSIFLFDVIIKGSVAVYLFSFTGINEFTILCVVTLMWLLNFVLPSIFGSYYVLNFNLPKDEA